VPRIGVAANLPVDVLVRLQRAARRLSIRASRARAIHGVSCHAASVDSGPAPGSVSSLSQRFTQPGAALASRTTASTQRGARLAAEPARADPAWLAGR
jgi:hypothetical protein